MKSVSNAAAAAITSPERVIDHVVTVDWDGDGVQDIDTLTKRMASVTLSQSLDSTLPEQVRVVPGAAVAQLDVEIDKGNIVRYGVNAGYRTISTATSNSTQTISVPAPSGLQEGDVVLVAIFDPLNTNPLGVPYYTNVTWSQLSWRGDGVPGTRVEGMLLMRRAVGTSTANPTGEPSQYTFTFGSETSLFVAAAVRVGDAGNMGIADFSTKGADDNTSTYTTVNGLPVDVYTPGSTIVGFWALQSPLVSGIGWSPRDGDTEQADFGTTAIVAPNGNIRMAVMTADNVSPGTYVKRADITGSSTVTSAIQFTVVISPKLAGDESQHAAWTFSELNTSSTYAGKNRIGRRTKWSVQVFGDNGPESVPLFTGLSVSAGADAQNRNAALIALDNRELFRNTGIADAQWSGVVAESPVILDPSGQSNLPGLESTWFVSFIFALGQQASVVAVPDDYGINVGNGFFASPRPLPGSCYTWIPCHGSMYGFFSSSWWAFTRIGSLTRRVKFVDGPFVAATEVIPVGGVLSNGWAASGGANAVFGDTNSQFKGRIEVWLRLTNTGATAVFNLLDDFLTFTRLVQFNVNTGGILSLVLQNPSTTRNVNGPAVPTDGLWHFYGVYFDSTNGVNSATFRIDTTNTTVAFTGLTNNAQSQMFAWGTITLRDGIQMSDFYAHGGIVGPFPGHSTGPLLQATDSWMNENFTPTAFIDKSENILDAVPLIPETEDTWTTLSNIAAAESAAVYFDADGYPHFRTARSNVSPTGQTVQRALTARTAIKDLSYESGIAQIINQVSVPYTQIVAYVDQLAYQASGAVYLPAGSTMDINVQLPGPVLSLGSPTFTANTAADGTGNNITAYIQVSLSSTTFSITVSLTNTYYFGAWFVNGSGQPALTAVATWMGPSNVTVTPELRQDNISIRKYRVQAMEINSSVWRQRQDAAASIATYLVSELAQPHPTVKQVAIVGDPRLELGDMVTLQDINGVGVNGNYRIVGKDTTSQNQLSQSLTVRQATIVARWGVNYWNDGSVWGVVSS